MAAVVKCDSCGGVVEYDKAMHVRFHHLKSPVAYYSGAELECDVCEECFGKILQLLNIGGEE